MARTSAVVREWLQRLGQDFPGLEGGYRAFAAAVDPGVGQAGEGVAVAQVRQGEQGPPVGVDSAPAGSSLVAVGASVGDGERTPCRG